MRLTVLDFPPNIACTPFWLFPFPLPPSPPPPAPPRLLEYPSPLSLFALPPPSPARVFFPIPSAPSFSPTTVKSCSEKAAHRILLYRMSKQRFHRYCRLQLHSYIGNCFGLYIVSRYGLVMDTTINNFPVPGCWKHPGQCLLGFVYLVLIELSDSDLNGLNMQPYHTCHTD